jgi:hypothetical protein
MIGLFEFVAVVDDKSKFLLHNSAHAKRVGKGVELEVWVLNERRSSLRILRESIIWKDGNNESYLLDSIIELEDRKEG